MLRAYLEKSGVKKDSVERATDQRDRIRDVFTNKGVERRSVIVPSL